MGETYVDTYRGCDIYRYTPPSTPEIEYGSPCVVGLFFTVTAIKKRICMATEGVWVDGVCQGVPPPPTPPPPEPYLEEVYRGVEIWWTPSLGAYRSEIAEYGIAVFLTLPEMRTWIDEAMAFLYPVEDPYEGLFAQVIAAVQTWVMGLMPEWVLEWGQNIYNTVNNIVENITNVYNDLREYVTNVYNNVYETIENTYNTFREYVTNVYNYLTEEITNVYNNTYNYFSEVIGASVEWVEERLADNREWTTNFFKLMDPGGFLKDPVGFINAAFAIQGEIANTLAVRSFWMGFEEGLAEEVA